MFVILYSGDAMLKTENPKDLQQILDRLYDAIGSMDIL